MRIDQLEDRILIDAYELYDEACLDLCVDKNLRTVRRRVARLKELTDQLEFKGDRLEESPCDRQSSSPRLITAAQSSVTAEVQASRMPDGLHAWH
jgi:hypothetical protein